MVLNETAILSAPVIGPIATFIKAISVIVGGIFGLYVILIILRWLEYKRVRKGMKEMKLEFKEINKRLHRMETKTSPKKIKKR